MSSPYFIMMLGAPGSGKSFVSEWLAPVLRAVHLRSDDMRLEMYGQDRLELHRNPRFTRPLYSAMDYAARQILTAGASVIYDANLNQRKTRARLAQVAAEAGATSLIVHVTAPLEVAEERVRQRSAQSRHQHFGDIAFVRRMAANIEPPTPTEHLITLDGLAPATEQLEAFRAQLATIRV